MVNKGKQQRRLKKVKKKVVIEWNKFYIDLGDVPSLQIVVEESLALNNSEHVPLVQSVSDRVCLDGLRCLVWKLSLNGVATLSNLARRGVLGDCSLIGCALCGSSTKIVGVSLRKFFAGIVQRKNDVQLDASKKASKGSYQNTHLRLSFNKLLGGAVFVMSGFVNPERGMLRSQALEMGAKYQSEWNSGCTLLICSIPKNSINRFKHQNSGRLFEEILRGNSTKKE
ncbi:unnamed protein product [Lupinus luteus]|uniref:BRCT domain-containing protein n=1 Tax=Lupinus luteus TaxID=3873 RepID=A0AAV1XNU3_LUPLU